MSLKVVAKLAQAIRSGAHNYRKMVLWTVELSRAHPWRILAAALLLTILSLGYAFRHISINTNTTDILFAHSGFQKTNRRLEQTFPSLRDRIILIVKGRSPFLAQQAATAIVKRLKQSRHEFGLVYSPEAGNFFRKNGFLYLKKAELQRLLKKLVTAEPLLGHVSNDPTLDGLFHTLTLVVKNVQAAGNLPPSSLSDLFGQLQTSIETAGSTEHYVNWGTLFGLQASRSQDERLVIATLPEGANTATDTHRALKTIHTTIRELNLNAAHGVNVNLTGSIILNQDQLTAVTQGARFATVLSLILVTIILVLGLRSAKLLIAVLITLLMGLVWTSTFALVAIGPFNLISVAFAVLFVGLGVDFGIQFCVRYQEALYEENDASSAIRSATKGIGFALTLAALAAAASFYSVVPTGYSGIKDLGLIAGSGVFIALIANLTVLPALLSVFNAGKASVPRPPLPFSKLAPNKTAVPILAVALLAVGAAAFLSPKVGFEFNLSKLQNQHTKAMKALRSLEHGVQFSPLSIEGLAPNLPKAEAIADKLRQMSSVSSVVTANSLIPKNQDEKLALIRRTADLVPPFVLQGASTEKRSQPEKVCRSMAEFGQSLNALDAHGISEAAARLQSSIKRFTSTVGCSKASVATLHRTILSPLLYQIRSLAMALTAAPVTVSNLPSDLKTQYLSKSGVARLQVFSKSSLNDTASLKRFVTQVERILPEAGGTPVLFVKGGNIVVSAFRKATFISVALIILLIFLVLHRPLAVVLAITPLVLSVLMTLASMAIFQIDFNLGNIIVLPLTIGLSMAFSIYLILRWKEFNYDITEVLRSSIPEGVLTSGLTTLASFGSLMVSDDPAMSILGVTLTIALTSILITSLVVLPAILWIAQKRYRPAL